MRHHATLLPPLALVALPFLPILILQRHGAFRPQPQPQPLWTLPQGAPPASPQLRRTLPGCLAQPMLLLLLLHLRPHLLLQSLQLPHTLPGSTSKKPSTGSLIVRRG